MISPTIHSSLMPVIELKCGATADLMVISSSMHATASFTAYVCQECKRYMLPLDAMTFRFTCEKLGPEGGL